MRAQITVYNERDAMPTCATLDSSHATSDFDPMFHFVSFDHGSFLPVLSLAVVAFVVIALLLLLCYNGGTSMILVGRIIDLIYYAYINT